MIGWNARQDESVAPVPVVWQPAAISAEAIAIGTAARRERSVNARILKLHLLNSRIRDGPLHPLHARCPLGPAPSGDGGRSGHHRADEEPGDAPPPDEADEAEDRRHRRSSPTRPSARRIAKRHKSTPPIAASSPSASSSPKSVPSFSARTFCAI